MFILPVTHFSGSIPPSGNFLDSVLASAVCDLDATISSSYSGSGQTWANLITDPADGAAQTDYDFTLGATASESTDDPTFNGTPDDSAAFWSTDGGDFFKLATNTSFFENLHKTTGGTDWWIASAFQFAGTGSQAVYSGNTSIDEGIEILATSAAAGITVNIDRNSTRTNNNLDSGALVVGTDYLVIVSFELSTDDIKFWLNTTIGVLDTDASTSTSSAPNTKGTGLMARPSGGQMFKSGARYYHLSSGNEFLDDTKAALIFTHLRTRHGRDYTG